MRSCFVSVAALCAALVLSGCNGGAPATSHEAALQGVVQENAKEGLISTSAIGAMSAYAAANAVDSSTGKHIGSGGKTAIALAGAGLATDLLVKNAGKMRDIESEDVCEGASASVLPPLVAEKGIFGAIGSLTDGLGSVFDKEEGNGPAVKTVMLNELDKAFVQQKDLSQDCWAASLSAGRTVAKLKKVKQEQIVSMMKAKCPSMQVEHTARPFHVLLAVRLLKEKYDAEKAAPKWCQDPACIKASLENKRPVLVGMNQAHVVMLKGMDYIDHSVKDKDGKMHENYEVVNYYVLDPVQKTAGEALVKIPAKEFAPSADFLLTF